MRVTERGDPQQSILAYRILKKKSTTSLARLAEVVANLDEQTAQYESRRCMSCGICVAECPCGSIEMVAEDI
ncbi:MAG: hypothetical protein V7629_01085 [Motiliproteus sp.]